MVCDMATQVKIPFSALITGSQLALMSINVRTRAYGADGNVLEGAVGDPKISVCVLDCLEHFSISVKSLDASLASVTEEQITKSLKNRQYIFVELQDAYATPYAARSGYGVAYSVKAESAKIASPIAAATPANVGFGKPTKPATD